jgi:glutaredoxin|tara:strand:+ start:333 stop:707 length:375 start_codon:yes stop_codon:yes gene_type:complete
MEKITIYTQGNCGYCKTVKDALNKENIEFEEKLINEHLDEWSRINSLTNIPTTPTIHYKENYFVAGRDFPNPEVLVNILRNFNGHGDVSLFKVLENIKTLNYNMATAFGRLDQLLRQVEQKINK